MKQIINMLYKENVKAFKNNDVPVGVVIEKNNKIIAKAFNKKESKNISTKHAEIIAIEKACRKLKRWRLDDCVLYTSMEPCVMCIGDIAQSRIKKVYYILDNEKFGFSKIIKGNKIGNHSVELIKLETDDRFKEIIKKFFEYKR